MTAASRTIVEITPGYKEVDLEFRRARAIALSSLAHKKDRIRCPVVDTSRRIDVYGSMALPSTDFEGLRAWCTALDMPLDIVKHLAYITSSGSLWSVIPNEINGDFDDQVINDGLGVSLKNGVNSNILSKFYFDQEKFNECVWASHPDLKGTAINEEYLYSEKGDGLFLEENMIDDVVAHNATNSLAWNTWLGQTLNKYGEFRPLLKFFGQKLTAGGCEENSIGSVLLVRDFHDLCKYGLFPALAEENLLAAGLVNESSTGLTAKPMQLDEN